MPNLCKVCPDDLRGKCCYLEAHVKGIRILTDHPCSYLNEATKKCTCYHDRHHTNPDCLHIAEMIEHGTVPLKCPYVQFNQEYQKRKDRRLYPWEFEIQVRR